MSITQVVAKALRAMIQAIDVTNGENITRQTFRSKVGTPMMKKLTFNWDTKDKYNDLSNFRLEVNNIFKSYNMPDTEKMAIIKLLSRQGLQLLETLPQAE